jgi:hypothetical protein
MERLIMMPDHLSNKMNGISDQILSLTTKPDLKSVQPVFAREYCCITISQEPMNTMGSSGL